MTKPFHSFTEILAAIEHDTGRKSDPQSIDNAVFLDTIVAAARQQPNVFEALLEKLRKGAA